MLVWEVKCMNKQLVQLTDAQLEEVIGGDFKDTLAKVPGGIFNIIDAPGQFVARGVRSALNHGKESPFKNDGENAINGFANFMNLATEASIFVAVAFACKFAWGKLKPMIFKKTA